MAPPGPARRIGAALCLACVALALTAAASQAAVLRPPAGQVFFGVSDTGENSGFDEFSAAVGKHPAVVETFLDYGHKLDNSIRRWRHAQARPILAISAADNSDGHELITPQALATGSGDDYLLKINSTLTAKGIRAYVRPLGEPNRCLNVWTAVDCSGHKRGGAHSFHWYKQAFRRIYIIVHGGGTPAEIDARLAAAKLPPLAPQTTTLPAFIPAAPVAVVWSPLPGGSPRVRINRPARYYPGDAYTDWVATDIYSVDVSWSDVAHFYSRFKGKPVALTEFGVVGVDDPGFVSHVFRFVRHDKRVRMLAYYQDFGSSSPYRIQNYPGSLAVLQRNLRQSRFPAFAPFAPGLGTPTG